MLHSIATVSISGNLRDKLEAIAAAGFTGVEIFENDLLSFDGGPEDVRRFAEQLGLKIVAFQPFRDFEGMPEPQRSRGFARAERKFDLMEELGTDLLLVCSNVSPHSLPGIERAAADLRELGERAAPRGLRIGFEALAWGKHINDYRDAWEAVRLADHPAVGTILDSFHILSRGLDLAAITSIPKERIFMVQMADAPLMEMGVLQWSRHFRCFPGQGRLPLVAFMEALQATGFDGIWSLEIFNDQFRAAPPGQIAIDGRRSLLRLAEQASEQRGDDEQGPAPSPPRISYDGVEFLEFAVDEETASGLETLLRQFGFQLAGRHRSKAVKLWRQGEINLVVNTDPEGFAHHYNLIHGPAVCAMGFRVDDAQKALERARTYLCQPFTQAVGPGELEIPAIRGLENSLIYLVDRHGAKGSIWEVDFEPVDTDPKADAGLQHIDHLDMVLPYQQLSTWQLWYCSVFGLEGAEQYDMPDPNGLIQSQVVQSPGRRVRITLSASQSFTTMANRFVARYYGGGVQQIALSTDNIVATLEKLEANGISMLPIPENYYDDLEARFGLAPDLLETLQRHNILYDQNDDGEFLHAYGHTFAGRFYFEIVERRNYRDFGTVNAAIRLAAQTRMAQGGMDP